VKNGVLIIAFVHTISLFFSTFSLSLSIFHFQHIISGLFQEKEDYRPRSTGLGSSGGAGGRRKHSFDDGNNIARGREGGGGPKPPRDWKCLEVNCNISYDVFRLVYVFFMRTDAALMVHLKRHRIDIYGSLALG